MRLYLNLPFNMQMKRIILENPFNLSVFYSFQLIGFLVIDCGENAFRSTLFLLRNIVSAKIVCGRNWRKRNGINALQAMNKKRKTIGNQILLLVIMLQ